MSLTSVWRKKIFPAQNAVQKKKIPGREIIENTLSRLWTLI